MIRMISKTAICLGGICLILAGVNAGDNSSGEISPPSLPPELLDKIKQHMRDNTSRKMDVTCPTAAVVQKHLRATPESKFWQENGINYVIFQRIMSFRNTNYEFKSSEFDEFGGICIYGPIPLKVRVSPILPKDEHVYDIKVEGEKLTFEIVPSEKMNDEYNKYFKPAQTIDRMSTVWGHNKEHFGDQPGQYFNNPYEQDSENSQAPATKSDEDTE